MASQSHTLHPDLEAQATLWGKTFWKRLWICQLKKIGIICSKPRQILTLEEHQQPKGKPMNLDRPRDQLFHLIKSKKSRYLTTGPEVQEKVTIQTLGQRKVLKQKRNNLHQSKKRGKGQQWLDWQASSQTENPQDKRNPWKKIARKESVSKSAKWEAVYRAKQNWYQMWTTAQRMFWRRWNRSRNITTTRRKFTQRTIRTFQRKWH